MDTETERSTSKVPVARLQYEGAFDSTSKLLRRPPSVSLLDSVASIVSLRDFVTDAQPAPATVESAARVSLLSPVRRERSLFMDLQDPDELEKKEAELAHRNPDTSELTRLAMGGEGYSSSKEALERLEALCEVVPRRVCQHPFKRNDIVWVCRTCQADETCVLCHSCYTASNHVGHDVAFYHAQAGGCCDCGDPDAWDPKGFCPNHGPSAQPQKGETMGPLDAETLERVDGMVTAIADWIVDPISVTALESRSRAISQDLVEVSNPPLADQGGVAGVGDDAVHPRPDQLDASPFSPGRAGSTKSNRPYLTESPSKKGKVSAAPPVASPPNKRSSPAIRIGRKGLAGRGLFLVLHYDDIHTRQDWPTILRRVFDLSAVVLPDSTVHKLITLLKRYGQLIIWGTAELIHELGSEQTGLWIGGIDHIAAGRFGNAILSKAAILENAGFSSSIKTLDEIESEQNVVAVVQWLTALARSCDPLCQRVAESIQPDRHLSPLLSTDFELNPRITKYWHALLLTLLAIPAFKSHLAAAYCDTYLEVTARYAQGFGLLERSGYALSVQFLNRVTYVTDLVKHKDLLGKIGKALLQTLKVAAIEVPTVSGATVQRLNPNHFVLAHRRYSPCISDLKCVLNVDGMPRLFASTNTTFLLDWVKALGACQLMDAQTWREFSEGHVELEGRGWIGAFNASISLGSLYERLLAWKDEDTSPISEVDSPLSSGLLSCVDLTVRILTDGILPWQREEEVHYLETRNPFIEPHKKSVASLPFAVVSQHHGTDRMFRSWPMSQSTPFSFHLPLHRFVATALREVCLRSDGMEKLWSALDRLDTDARDAIVVGMMEFPTVVLARAGQIKAGLWRRNGPGLNDQLLNYSEPPFCRAMRDSDLLLAQFTMLCGRFSDGPTQSGVARFVHLLLHRLGAFEFCDVQPKDLAASFSDSSKARPVWNFTPAHDVASKLLLLEEFLHTMVMLAVELPSIAPTTKSERLEQARSRLRREVIHKLASGPKTHSELAEVHYVLSHWDNHYLSEEGKLENPDDASGAALESILRNVADRKASRSKMEPDKWTLKNDAWELYDPSFYHISLRDHQSVAENRPLPPREAIHPKLGLPLRAFCPRLSSVNPAFERLRRDISCDAATLCVVFKTLHIHCFNKETVQDIGSLPGHDIYTSAERSEVALARAVHLLTLGAFAWEGASATDTDWRSKGGDATGSVFADFSGPNGPTARDWVNKVLLSGPQILTGSSTYENQGCMLELLRVLAVAGGWSGSFIAQDKAVRSGAAWLLKYATEHSYEAQDQFGSVLRDDLASTGTNEESELDRRKRIAKQKAMERMKAQAAKFASLVGSELENDEDNEMKGDKAMLAFADSKMRRQGSSSGYSSQSNDDDDKVEASSIDDRSTSLQESSGIPKRLMESRPSCIICNDDPNADVRSNDEDISGKRSSRRKRGSNALSFVGYTQASTVLKGGGGLPSPWTEDTSPYAAVRRFVGAHVSLCGHAVHSECWESYLASVSHREDRSIGKRDEFRCPLCQRLSNCLIPFIDVGVDWISCEPVRGDTHVESDLTRNRLDTFLQSSPWWCARHNKDVFWDGHSAFVTKTSPFSSGESETDSFSSSKISRRRSVRSLRKKDLYAAWNTIMKTPRFMRLKRSNKPLKLEPAAHDGNVLGHGVDGEKASSETSGETVVWRRFMDQVGDICYRSDGRRLGDSNLQQDLGEFRHYVVEKYSYNHELKLRGRSPMDWPSCVFESVLSETMKQEFSREKLLSKLFLSVQSFVYSCCCEGHEVRRLAQKCGSAAASRGSEDAVNLGTLSSTYGIADVTLGGRIILLPSPTADDEGGSQPFRGRLGRLRYLGLAVMAGTGVVAADFVQLAMQFPALESAESSATLHERAPLVYPILCGNVLTHVVAAVCASSGRARARSDSADLVWPVPFSRQGSFMMEEDHLSQHIDSAVDDCIGFVKLGLLARILQVLLAVCSQWMDSSILSNLRLSIRTAPPNEEDEWITICLSFLDIACISVTGPARNELAISDARRDFLDACRLALMAAHRYLVDICPITQILLPGMADKYAQKAAPTSGSIADQESFSSLESMLALFGFEDLDKMLESGDVRELLCFWCQEANRHMQKAGDGSSGDPSKTRLQRRLFRTQGYRIWDWPMSNANVMGDQESLNASMDKKPSAQRDSPSMSTDPAEPSTASDDHRGLGAMGRSSSSLVKFSSARGVPFIGCTDPKVMALSESTLRISQLPTSYTDLYAELGQILPDCEQTAVCLVCGTVLVASGKGECTRHSYHCGAGSGIFFLLQECTSLIMHNTKAAYMHSPYVDSHGETPQYRGRPLYLDMDRYDHFHEIWSGHLVRQKVQAERLSSKQVIVPDYY